MPCTAPAGPQLSSICGAGLTATQREPATSSWSYQDTFTTFAAEAEFLPELGGAAGGSFRVLLNNTSLRSTRKMAVGVTMVSYSTDGSVTHQVNNYYGSQLQCEVDPACRSTRAVPFVPYAIVRSLDPMSRVHACMCHVRGVYIQQPCC